MILAIPFIFLSLMELRELNEKLNLKSTKSNNNNKDYPIFNYDYNGKYYTSEGVIDS